MPKKKPISNLNKLTYETFLRSVKLYVLALDEVQAKLDREKYWEHSKISDSVTREIGATYVSAEVEEDHFNVEAKFELTISAKADKSVMLEIKCHYSAHFHVIEGRNSKEAAERFAKSEAKIIVWPYFRSLVSDITARMHIPPITIPITLD